MQRNRGNSRHGAHCGQYTHSLASVVCKESVRRLSVSKDALDFQVTFLFPHFNAVKFCTPYSFSFLSLSSTPHILLSAEIHCYA